MGWIKAFFIPQISIFQAWKRRIYKVLTESVKNPLAESFHFCPTLRTLHKNKNAVISNMDLQNIGLQNENYLLKFSWIFFKKKSQFYFVRQGKWLEDVKTKKLKKRSFLQNLVDSIGTFSKAFYFRNKFLWDKFAFQEYILIVSFRKNWP